MLKRTLVYLLSLLILVTDSATPSNSTGRAEGDSSSYEEQKTRPHGNLSLPAELHFGLTPYLPEDLLRREFEPLMAYLSLSLDIPVHLVISPNYEGLGTQLEKGHVDIASFSPLAYVLEKRRNASLRLLLGQIVGGATSYTTYIIVHSEHGIYQLEHLKGKAFSFVDRNSASGYLFPYAFFLKQGVVPEEFFSQVLFAGNHLKAIQYVIEGKVDAAATYSEALVAARESGVRVGSLRIIKKTGRIPYDAVCARGDLDLDLVHRVSSLLLHLDMSDDQGRRVLGNVLRINGWIEVSDEQYATVRQVLDMIEHHGSSPPSSGIR